MSRLRFDHDALSGRVLFGAGRLAELPAELERLGSRRPLLVAASSQAETAARFETAAAGVVRGASQHVPVEEAEAARRAAADTGADGLVALGGGSAIGLAKAVALTAGLPLVAVPTTYSGSEMTTIWGLSEGGRKTTGRDPAVLPRTVIYDPELTRSLPAHVAGPSGMNALAHAAESLWVAAATRSRRPLPRRRSGRSRRRSRASSRRRRTSRRGSKRSRAPGSLRPRLP
jgi:maleylacetate reductase